MAKAKKTSANTQAFVPPAESEWHRRISEAAYYRSQKPELSGESVLDNWIAAELEVKVQLSAEAKAPKRPKRARRARRES
jgi:hypothetical protein